MCRYPEYSSRFHTHTHTHTRVRHRYCRHWNLCNNFRKFI